MKNVTKANVLFSFTVVFYLLCAFIVRLIPYSVLGVNARMIVPELALIIPAVLYVSLMKPSGLEGMTFEFPSGRNILRIIVITFCIMPFIGLINSISTIFVENEASEALSMLLPNKMWISVVIMALIPAVCEEYIFRGLLFNGYKKRNPFGAMLMSSFLFGLIHMNINQFSYAFVMGMIFCLLVYATGTIMSSMIAHFLFNAYNVISYYQMADILSELEKAAEDVSAEELSQATVQLSQGQQALYMAMGFCIALIIVILGLKIAHSKYVKICDSNRGYENVRRIFSKENRKKLDDNEGRFFDFYILTGIVLCMISMFL